VAAVAKAAGLVERLGRGTPTELARATGADLVAHYLDPARRRPGCSAGLSVTATSGSANATSTSSRPSARSRAPADPGRFPTRTRPREGPLSRHPGPTPPHRDDQRRADRGAPGGPPRRPSRPVLARRRTGPQVHTCHRLDDGDEPVGGDPDDHAITEAEIPTTAFAHALAAATAGRRGCGGGSLRSCWSPAAGCAGESTSR
jgi:hypothetical protein